MKWLFWLCFALMAYTYVGYAVLLGLLARLRPRPVACGLYEPSVSIVIAARNEAANLPAKIENSSAACTTRRSDCRLSLSPTDRQTPPQTFCVARVRPSCP